jgi:hypothetical protein
MASYTRDDFTASDRYHNSFLIAPDDALDAAAQSSADHGLPDIAVSRAQGKFLMLLARSIGAKRILEVGTLGGCVPRVRVPPPWASYAHAYSRVCIPTAHVAHRYSTIWLSRALPADGKLVTCELNPEHAKVRALGAPRRSRPHAES